MADEAARRAHEIFMKALDVEPEGQAVLIDAECGDDAALRRDVESLLRAHGAASAFLERPAMTSHRAGAGTATAQRDGAALLGHRIGRYTLEEVIASGGMGTVYLATQDRLYRRVAVKVLDRGRTSHSARRRFDYEAEILAKLEHPNIARIHEAGVDGEGPDAVSFFAMEYIAGARSITDYARHEGLSLDARLALFVKVCDAVSFAHQHGIIHRDLKPANILVDLEGEPKVIDFGVARITRLGAAITTLKTQAGQIMGTLAYMSPEQVEAEPSDIDIRSDVYSLGVILYELLCERLPTKVDTSSLLKVAERIRTEPPERPAAIRPALRGDVETIVLKALEKDRRGRYQSARELADDLRRYLASEPIMATPPTLIYLFGKFARRHRILVSAAAVVLLVLVAATVVSTVFAVRTDRESDRRLKAELDARRAEQATAAQRDAAQWQAYVANIAAAEAASATREFRRMRSRLAAATSMHRGWEWHYLNRLSDQSRYTMPHNGRVMSVAASPDSTRVATAGTDGLLWIWDLATGSLLSSMPRLDSAEYAVAFHPDGRQVVSGSVDGMLRIWDVDRGRLARELRGHTGAIHAVAYNSDGSQIVSGSWDLTARVWHVDDPARDATLEGHAHRLRAALFTPDDRFVITGADDHTIRIWNAATGAPERMIELEAGEVRAVAISPDGRLLAAGATDHTLRLWDTATWAPAGVFRDHEDVVWSVAFSGDGALLASGSADQTIRVRSVAAPDRVTVLPGHAEVIQSLSFTPDGRLLISGSWDQTAKAWDAQVLRDEFSVVRAHDTFVRWIAFAPDGSMFATASTDRRVRLWNPRTLDALATLGSFAGAVRAVEFSPDGLRLAAAGEDRVIRVWSLPTGRQELVLRGHEDTVYSVSFSPDGDLVASGSADGTMRLWDARTGEPLAVCDDHEGNVWQVAFSADGRRLASASWDDTIRIWDPRTLRNVRDARQPECLHTLTGHEGDIYAMVFSRDGRRLYSGTRNQEIKVWDVESGRNLATETEHGQFITGMALLPDESRLISASIYQTIKLWSPERMEDVLTVRGLDASIRCVAVDPDGSRIFTGLSNGHVHMMDLLDPVRREADRAEARRRIEQARRWLDEHVPPGADDEARQRAWRGDASAPADLLPAIRWAMLTRHAWDGPEAASPP